MSWYSIVRPRLGNNSAWVMSEDEFDKEAEELYEQEAQGNVIIRAFDTEAEATADYDKALDANVKFRYYNS